MYDMRKIAYTVSAIVLTGCGGGGGDSQTNTSTGFFTAQSAPRTYTVTVNAGTGGSVPQNSYTINDGDKLTFNVTLNEGYELNEVSGCNGTINGNTYTTGNISSNCTINLSFKEKSYFVEVKNAFDVQNPFTITSAIAATTLDVNNDNLDDLVVHFWSGEYSNTHATAPCRNDLRIYVLQPDKTFKDQTATYIQGSNDLGGCSRKVKKADINQDGKMDLIFAINHEEGRIITVTGGENNTLRKSNADAQLAALVSVGNLYRVQKYNSPRWYHSVGAGINNNRQYFVTGAGYTGPNVYAHHSFDKQGNVFEANVDIPRVSPNTFEFYNKNGDMSETTYLLQASNGVTEEDAHIEGYLKKDGKWVRLANSNPFGKPIGKFKDSDFLPIRMDNQVITAVQHSESCVTRLSPNGDQITIFKMHYNIVKEPFVDGMSIGNTMNSPASLYRGVTIENDKIVEVPLNIKGEVRENVNINFFDCKDVTGDGYNDIVSYSYSNTGLPHVYVNNKDNSFTYIGQKMFPDTYTVEYGNVYSTLLHDFDKDGFMDFVFWPANGIKTEGKMKFTFFKGQRKL